VLLIGVLAPLPLVGFARLQARLMDGEQKSGFAGARGAYDHT
jgi:hypothetical protein